MDRKKSIILEPARNIFNNKGNIKGKSAVIFKIIKNRETLNSTE